MITVMSLDSMLVGQDKNQACSVWSFNLQGAVPLVAAVWTAQTGAAGTCTCTQSEPLTALT